ncbi:hypothetical protein AB1J28_20240 [Lysinibacillus irui]|uniref:hypothetical protein n=1 Tax=Lysinibacillus irui TaxID=2998077 RepID=UPI003D265B10
MSNLEKRKARIEQMMKEKREPSTETKLRKYFTHLTAYFQNNASTTDKAFHIGEIFKWKKRLDDRK